MRRFVAAAAVILSSAASMQAGPLFDDYLNHVRPGPSTEPGSASIAVSANAALRQPFAVDASVGEIYRIGLRPVYDTWQPGETVTLTLFGAESPNPKLASYAIGQETSRVQAVHNTKDYVLYWHLRALSQKHTRFYFELTVAGGDGSVSFQALADKTISHAIHIKPVADAEANRRTFFTERLDIDRPELARVKSAVAAKDWERAIAAAAAHFHGRQDAWADYAGVLQEKPRLDADTELADLVMKNQLRHVETKQPLTWRPEDYWIPEWPTDRAQPKHGADPSLYTWHIDRFLAAAYSNTGKPEYARRCIDLRMRFILDNPNPKLTGVPWYFELWNDRTAAARAPGHGLLPYARLYNYDGWTNDERLVFFSFLEDNARWDYQAESGANWGAEAARACYEFGLKFPEWKMSPEYVQWGTGRLAEIVLADVRGDGTSTEAAVKYHAMVARRLKGMLEDHVEGRIRLEADTLRRLMKSVEGMYEHMAYTLMPNNFVVMCGDSWYENFAYKPMLGTADLLDADKTIRRFAASGDALSRHIRAKIAALSPAARAAFDEPLRAIDAHKNGSEPASDELRRSFIALLNKIVAPGIANPNEPSEERISEAQAWLHDEGVFAGCRLRPQTRGLLRTRPTGAERELLNRMLIEDAWPGEIRKGYEGEELHAAARLVNRPDFSWIASQGLEGEPPAEASKIFPGGGYFIMRSDFGAKAESVGTNTSAAIPPVEYRNSRQLFIHNGNWFGSHGHWDLTSVNLYAFGRPLIIDPGQYEYEPPPGINRYWESKIHSMLVPDGRDCRREAGPCEWVSNRVIDWFDGRHGGFAKSGQIGDVRRRVAFIKPDYFVIDDSADASAECGWAQCWNLTDTNAAVEDNGGTIATTFAAAGNVLILNQNPARFAVEIAEGITSAKQEYPRTRIVRLKEATSRPRFQTLVYPFDGPARPEIGWSMQAADATDKTFPVEAFTVRAKDADDWMAFGRRGMTLTFAGGRHEADADFALVRADAKGEIERFAWASGRRLAYNGELLADAGAPVHALGVTVAGDRLAIDAPEPESTLRVRAGRAKSFVLNGAEVTRPVVRDGMYLPFAHEPRTLVADNRDAFERLTQTDEWEQKTDPGAWSGTYLQHETDPGRHENGDYLLDVPESGRYRVEAHLPTITVAPSDRVEYRLIAEGVAAQVGGPVVAARSASRTHVVTLDQQTMAGWVPLGEFALKPGRLRVNARNATETDGLYFIADAVRIVPVP